MIISRTPFRVSFFGGGTDYSAWYLKQGGAVLSTTIDKYIYITARFLPPFFPERHRIIWSRVEGVDTIGEIQHPAIREGLRQLEFDDEEGLDIHYQGDLPARSGVGSSSSFAVGLLNALHALQGRYISRHDLALAAINLEQVRLNEAVGAQDQVAVAYGGLNRINFLQNGEITVDPVILSPERVQELEAHLMFCYTGISRFGSTIAADIIQNIPSRSEALREMHAMVDQSIDLLVGGKSIAEFGVLLDRSWRLKRSLSDQVSNPNVDGIYQTAIESGAFGGKLLGAGESGFMMFLVPPEKQDRVKRALNLLQVPIRLSFQGSTIIHYNPELKMAS